MMDQSKNKIEQEKQALISDLEQAVEVLHQNSERIQSLEKSFSQSEWYLGEAKARSQRLEDEIRDKEHYIRKIEAELHELKAQVEELKKKDRPLKLSPRDE